MTPTDLMEANVSRVPRVLFAIGGLGSGGSETQLTEIASRLHPGRVEAHVVLIDPTSGTRRLARLARAGVTIHIVGPLRGQKLRDTARLVRRYDRLLREIEPDVVYPWLEETTMFLAPIARLHRIPVLAARRNTCGSTLERIRLLRLAIRRAEASVRLVTCNSRAVAEAAIARGVPSERIRIVFNGHPALGPLPLPTKGNGDVVLGYLARFRAEKGHRRLVAVLTQLPVELPWRVHLGGDGPLEEEVRGDVERLGLADRVRFLGEVSDARAFWADCDVAVLLSDYEGSPNALIEAGFAGRPLVATATTGSAELVHPGIGYAVPLDDPGGIADALMQLISSSELRGRLGAAAHRDVSSKYEMTRSLDGHLEAILEACHQRKVG